MAAPNTLVPKSITSKTTPLVLTGSWATVVSNAASSGKVVQIIGLLVSNSSNGAATISVRVLRAGYGGNAEYPLVPSGSVSAGACAAALPTGEEFRLEEGDSLQAKILTGTGATLFCSHNVLG